MVISLCAWTKSWNGRSKIRLYLLHSLKETATSGFIYLKTYSCLFVFKQRPDAHMSLEKKYMCLTGLEWSEAVYVYVKIKQNASVYMWFGAVTTSLNRCKNTSESKKLLIATRCLYRLEKDICILVNSNRVFIYLQKNISLTKLFITTIMCLDVSKSKVFSHISELKQSLGVYICEKRRGLPHLSSWTSPRCLYMVRKKLYLSRWFNRRKFFVQSLNKKI